MNAPRRTAALDGDAQNREKWPEAEQDLRAEAERLAAPDGKEQPVPVVAVAEQVEEPVDQLEVLHEVVGAEERQRGAVQAGGDDCTAWSVIGWMVMVRSFKQMGRERK